TFAGDVSRRLPELVLRKKSLDELAQRIQVAVELIVFLLVDRLARVLLVLLCTVSIEHTAEAGADRIDKNEIGELEPALLIIDQLCRRRSSIAVGFEIDALRAERSDMQIRRRSARSTVEDERNRPPATRFCRTVIGMKDLTGRLVALAQRDPFR